MPLKVKLKVRPNVEEEEQSPRVATSAKKGKRSRQAVYNTDSDSDGTRPSKRRTSVPAQPPPRTRPEETKSRKQKSNRTYSPDPEDSEQEERVARREEDEVDVEGYDSADARAPGATRQRATSERQAENDEDQNDLASTESSRSSSPGVPAPSRKQSTRRAERPPRTKANRIESEDEDDYAGEKQTSEGEYGQSRQADSPPRSAKPVPSMRAPTRQSTGSSSTPTATKPLRKPVGSRHKEKEAEKTSGSALSSIPAIPRRPRDVSAVVKETQDMDLLNKDVYNQLFNASSTSKSAAKNVQNEAKQKEIDAKRAAAKAALLQARTTSFDLQLPTDKVLAFESRLRKIHRWYAPSALGFTYHEELRNASQRQRQRQQQQ